MAKNICFHTVYSLIDLCLMMIDSKGSRKSMSWKALTSGKPYGENSAKIYRSQIMRMGEVISNRLGKFP